MPPRNRKPEKRSRPRARWGIDEVVEVEPFQVSDATFTQLRELLGLAGAPPRKLETVRRGIDDIATRHRTWCRQREAEASRAEATAALKEIEEAAEALAMRLATMDSRSEWELWLVLACDHPAAPGEARPDPVMSRVKALNALRIGARRAGKALARQRGPDKDVDLPMTIQRLVALFEDVTGERATHSAASGAIYDGRSRSPAGQFLTAFFAEVDPGLPSTRVANGLASLIRSRNEAARESAMESGRGGRTECAAEAEHGRG